MDDATTDPQPKTGGIRQAFQTGIRFAGHCANAWSIARRLGLIAMMAVYLLSAAHLYQIIRGKRVL